MGCGTPLMPLSPQAPVFTPRYLKLCVCFPVLVCTWSNRGRALGRPRISQSRHRILLFALNCTFLSDSMPSGASVGTSQRRLGRERRRVSNRKPSPVQRRWPACRCGQQSPSQPCGHLRQHQGDAPAGAVRCCNSPGRALGGWGWGSGYLRCE